MLSLLKRVPLVKGNYQMIVGKIVDDGSVSAECSHSILTRNFVAMVISVKFGPKMLTIKLKQFCFEIA